MSRKLRSWLVVGSCLAICATALAGGKGVPIDPETMEGLWRGSYKIRPMSRCPVEPCSGTMDLQVGVDATARPPELLVQGSVDLAGPYRMDLAAECRPASMNLRRWSGTLRADVKECSMRMTSRTECRACVPFLPCRHICWRDVFGCSAICAVTPFTEWHDVVGMQEVCTTVDSLDFTFSQKTNKTVTRMKVTGRSPERQKIKITLDKAA